MEENVLIEAKSKGKGKGKGKGESGFTLIELLIVIAIIAILAAIAIPMFMKYKQGAYLDSARSDVKNAVTAMEAFDATYGVYPTATSCGPGPAQCNLTNGSNTSTNALNVSPGDTVTITADNSCTNGYKVSASNSNIGASDTGGSGNPVSYDSCTGAYVGFGAAAAPAATGGK